MKVSKDKILKWFLIIWSILYLVVLFEEVIMVEIELGGFINHYKNIYDIGFLTFLPYLIVHLIFIIPIIAVYYIRKRLRKHS